MLTTNDSLVNLRMARKRSIFSSTLYSTAEKNSLSLLPATTPWQILQLHNSSKRMRVSNNTNQLLRKKSVQFALHHNKFHLPSFNNVNVYQTWMSKKELVEIRKSMTRTLTKNSKAASDNDPTSGRLEADMDNCLRGLEVYSSPAVLRQQIRSGRQLKSLVLQQQKLLLATEGRVNETLLGKMCHLLSKEDARKARQHGIDDAEEALYVHAEVSRAERSWLERRKRKDQE